MRYVTIALALMLAAPAMAQQPKALCLPSADDLAKLLRDEGGEVPWVWGVNGTGDLTVLYRNPVTGAWTVVAVNPQTGVSCALFGGYSSGVSATPKPGEAS